MAEKILIVINCHKRSKNNISSFSLDIKRRYISKSGKIKIFLQQFDKLSRTFKMKNSRLFQI